MFVRDLYIDFTAVVISDVISINMKFNCVFHMQLYSYVARLTVSEEHSCWLSTANTEGRRTKALRLCTGRTAHRGSRGIALPFHDNGTRRGRGVSVTLRPLITPGKDPEPIIQRAGWDPGPVWTGAENLAPSGIRSPDHPARNQSLYRLRYPVH